MSSVTSAAAASAAVASTQRDFMRIDLSDFDNNRRDEIVKNVMKASTGQGFFYGKS